MAGEPFAVLLGDDVVYADGSRGQKPAMRQLIDIYDAYGGSVLGCQQVLGCLIGRWLRLLQRGDKIATAWLGKDIAFHGQLSIGIFDSN